MNNNTLMVGLLPTVFCPHFKGAFGVVMGIIFIPPVN
jgi:hypothetical protein